MVKVEQSGTGFPGDVSDVNTFRDAEQRELMFSAEFLHFRSDHMIFTVGHMSVKNQTAGIHIIEAADIIEQFVRADIGMLGTDHQIPAAQQMEIRSPFILLDPTYHTVKSVRSRQWSERNLIFYSVIQRFNHQFQC